VQAVRDVWAADPAILRAGESPGPLGAVAGRRSILLADGADHLRMRRLMLPPFHGERMAALRGEVEAVAREAVDRWPRDRPVALLDELRRLTLDVILRAAFGVRDERLAADIRAALALARSLPRLAAMSLTPLGWRGFRRRLAVVDAGLRALIAERRARPREGHDILTLLLAARDEAGRPLEDEEVRDHLVTLIAAGHDTTAGAAAWALERLARRPDWCARLRDGDDAELDAVARETLRVRPVLTMTSRKLAAPLRVGGRTLPAGVHVAPCIYLVHRRPDVYPDPAAWRPERWLGGLGPAPDPAAWIPFGGGVRRCLGASFALMELRELLRAVTASARLEAVAARGERMRRRGITLQPGAGARVVLR
jgi:cytochrome P450